MYLVSEKRVSQKTEINVYVPLMFNTTSKFKQFRVVKATKIGFCILNKSTKD